MRFSIFAGLIAVSLAFLAGGAFAVNKIPVEAFASPPTFSSASLSPSGTKIAFMTAVEGRRHIMVLDRTTGKNVLVPPHEKMELGYFFWGNEETLIITFLLSRKREYISLRRTEAKLFSFNIKSLEYVWLGKPKKEATSMRGGSFGVNAALAELVLHRLPNEPHHILIQMRESIYRPLPFSKSISKAAAAPSLKEVEKVSTAGMPTRKATFVLVQEWYAEVEAPALKSALPIISTRQATKPTL